MGGFVAFAFIWIALAIVLVLASGSFGISRRISRRWYALHLARLARRIRLYLHDGTLRLTGWLDGHYVVAWRDPYSAHVAVRIWPGLDLGLRRLERGERNAREYAHLLMKYSREYGRSQFLLDGEVMGMINKARFDVEILDDWILVSDGISHQFHKLPKMLHLALEVAETIAKHRKQLALPPALTPLSQAVTQLGAKHRLAPLGSPLGYEGSAFGGNVAIFIRRDDSSKELACVVARFREPLDIGFCAERGRPPAFAWSQAHFTVGEPEFDERYTVSAAETEYVQRALSPSARARLCDMADRGRKVRVDDYGITIECDASRAAELEQICTEAAEVAELVDFMHPKKLGNPYR